jgi:hypothetical protein
LSVDATVPDTLEAVAISAIADATEPVTAVNVVADALAIPLASELPDRATGVPTRLALYCARCRPGRCPG